MTSTREKQLRQVLVHRLFTADGARHLAAISDNFRNTAVVDRKIIDQAKIELEKKLESVKKNPRIDPKDYHQYVHLAGYIAAGRKPSDLPGDLRDLSIPDCFQEIYRDGPHTRLGRLVHYDANTFVFPYVKSASRKHQKGRTIREIQAAFKKYGFDDGSGNGVTKEEEAALRKYLNPGTLFNNAPGIVKEIAEVATTESGRRFLERFIEPGNHIPFSNRQIWRTKWIDKDNGNFLEINGGDLVLEIRDAEHESLDLNNPTSGPSKDGKHVIKERLQTTLDDKGGFIQEEYFPSSGGLYEQRKAKENRHQLATAFQKNLQFNEIFGLRKKGEEYFDQFTHLPSKYRSKVLHLANKSGVERLMGTSEEAQIRRSMFITELNKTFAKQFADTIVDHFNTTGNDMSGRETLKALGVDIRDCVEEDGRTVDGAKAIIRALAVKLRNDAEEFRRHNEQRVREGKEALKIPSRPQEPQKPSAGAPAKIIAKYEADILKFKEEMWEYQRQWEMLEDDMLTDLVEKHYIQLGFGEHSAPQKIDKVSATNLEGLNSVQLRDTHYRPDMEAAKAFVMDLIYNTSGKKIARDNGVGVAANTKIEIVQGLDDFRVKITKPDGSVIFIDPDNYYDYQARIMAAGEAAQMHQQISNLAKDPLNAPVVMAYQMLGNTLWSTLAPRVLQDTYGNVLKILKDRNSLLPKTNQLSTRAIEDWAKLILKRTLLSPMYAYDPINKMAIPRYAYAFKMLTNKTLDWLAGDETTPGALDKWARNFVERRFAKNISRKYITTRVKDPATGRYRAVTQQSDQVWEPRILKRLSRAKRKGRTNIFGLALNIAIGIAVDGAIDFIVSNTIAGSKIAYVYDYVTHHPAFPTQWGNTLLKALPAAAPATYTFQTFAQQMINPDTGKMTQLWDPKMPFTNYTDDFIDILTKQYRSYQSPKFFGKEIYTLEMHPVGEEIQLMAKLNKDIFGNLARGFNVKTLQTIGNWTKTTFGLGKVLVGSVAKALPSAVVAGVVFNSPVAFWTIGGITFAPHIFTDFSKMVAGNVWFGKRFGGRLESFDTVGNLMGKRHDAFEYLKPSYTDRLPPKLFGLEKLMYKTYLQRVGYTNELAEISELRNTRLARFLHKGLSNGLFRGLLKGIGRAGMAFSLVYSFTGSIPAAIVATAGIIIGSVVYEQAATWAANKLAQYATRIAPVQKLVGIAGGMAMGGFNMAVGLHFVKTGMEAWNKMREGDSREWNEFVQQNFSSGFGWIFSASAVSGIATGAITIAAGASQLVRGLFFYGSKVLPKIFTSVPLQGSSLLPGARWGAMIGFAIGAVVGYLMGAQIGAMIGGTIAGAIGGAIGLAFTVGASILTMGIGIVIGAVVGGLIGSITGGLIQRWIEARFGGLSGAWNSAFSMVGKFLNLIKVIPMLFSKDLGTVGVAAFTLCTMGIFAFGALQNQQMEAASHIPGEGVLGDPESVVIHPPALSELNKSFEGFTDENSMTFKVTFTNKESSTFTFSIDDSFTTSREYSSDFEYKIEGLQSTFTSSQDGENFIITNESDPLNIDGIAAGDTKTFYIKYTHPTAKAKDIILASDGQRVCNKITIDGQLEDGTPVASKTITCIDSDGRMVGPKGSCPVGANNGLTADCHGGNANFVDIGMGGHENTHVYSPVDGKVVGIYSPQYATEQWNLHSVTGSYDGGWSIVVQDSKTGANFSIFHVNFNNPSETTMNGPYKVGDTTITTGMNVYEGQPIAFVWDGKIDGLTSSVYANPGRGGIGIGEGKTFWTGPHLHFGIRQGTNCNQTKIFLKESCGIE